MRERVFVQHYQSGILTVRQERMKEMSPAISNNLETTAASSGTKKDSSRKKEAASQSMGGSKRVDESGSKSLPQKRRLFDEKSDSKKHRVQDREVDTSVPIDELPFQSVMHCKSISRGCVFAQELLGTDSNQASSGYVQ